MPAYFNIVGIMLNMKLIIIAYHKDWKQVQTAGVALELFPQEIFCDVRQTDETL